MHLKSLITVLFCLFSYQLLAYHDCSDPNEGIFINFKSFTLSNAGGSSNLTFYIEAKDTQ